MGPCSRSEEDFVTEEQLEVARNGAVQQASSRGKADRFELNSSAKKSSSDQNRRGETSDKNSMNISIQVTNLRKNLWIWKMLQRKNT